MKKLIKELADEAGFLMWDGEEHAPVDAVVDWSCSYDYELEKFTELIVRKCLKIVEPTEDSGDEWCVTLKGTAQEIKQHFGVEDRAIPILSADEQALFAGIASSKLFTIEGAKKQFGVEE
jgi:hypothetical protein